MLKDMDVDQLRSELQHLQKCRNDIGRLIERTNETTSSLDSKTEREIARNREEVSRTRTTLIIAHRLSSVVHADEIIVLDAGAFVERGTHASPLAQKGQSAPRDGRAVVELHLKVAAANEGTM